MGNTRSDTESVTGDLKPRRKWSTLRVVGTLLAIAFTTFILFVGWQYWLYTGGIFKTFSFDRQEWRLLNRKTDDFSCYRGGMAHDIKTNILRAGQTTNEVETILGMPDSIKGSVHEYNLGMCSGLRIDFDSLDVHFNTVGQVDGVYIVQH